MIESGRKGKEGKAMFRSGAIIEIQEKTIFFLHCTPDGVK